MLWIKVVILGAVEGFTEFLPVSSTGHLIIVGQLLGFNDEKGKIFELVIQTGAMLAIVWEYRVKFAGLLSGITHDRKARQFRVESRDSVHARRSARPAARQVHQGGALQARACRHCLHRRRLDHIVGRAAQACDYRGVGRRHDVARCAQGRFAQAFALIPGTSRSGATIIGGLLFGLSRRAATEFSFFLAVPTLIAARRVRSHQESRAVRCAGYRHIRGRHGGFVRMRVACVRWLLRYIANHDFTPFAWYRIAFGLIVLGTGYFGAYRGVAP